MIADEEGTLKLFQVGQDMFLSPLKDEKMYKKSIMTSQRYSLRVI